MATHVFGHFCQQTTKISLANSVRHAAFRYLSILKVIEFKHVSPLPFVTYSDKSCKEISCHVLFDGTSHVRFN